MDAQVSIDLVVRKLAKHLEKNEALSVAESRLKAKKLFEDFSASYDAKYYADFGKANYKSNKAVHWSNFVAAYYLDAKPDVKPYKSGGKNE